ncbi:MAG: transcription antitermination factor NusB [Patescibacteria group bacterium]
MANRHLSRSLAMQSLFEWDERGGETKKLPEIIQANVAEFAPGIEDTDFVDRLVQGVVAKQAELDEIIEKAAPDWPINLIAPIDRNVLRMGLYELLFADRHEVPAKVAINEAIEIAKTFGGENSGKFVNGVLGTVYKELGEPGKDEVPAKKKRPKDVPYDEMPIETLGGAVVYARFDEEIKLAMVHDIFGYWTLSKGRIETGEKAEQDTAKKIKEEMALEVKILASLGTNEYIASDPERGKIRKQVKYFLAEALNPTEIHLPKKEEKGGLDDVRWFHLAEVPDLKMYDDVLPFVTKAIKQLNDAKN